VHASCYSLKLVPPAHTDLAYLMPSLPASVLPDHVMFMPFAGAWLGTHDVQDPPDPPARAARSPLAHKRERFVCENKCVKSESTFCQVTEDKPLAFFQ
jgi:hypothetical protein